jgi:urease accessory protein
VLPPLCGRSPYIAGSARLAVRRVGAKTVFAQAFAKSPLRLLTPRNHGEAAWAFLASFGGGLVDGDRIDVHLDVGAGASALVGTQASTKVYRSPRGCEQRLEVHAAEEAVVVAIPDPVVCFAGARYKQEIVATLAPGASLLLLDGYTCGRSARGERWQFDRYESRTTIVRGGRTAIVDASYLDGVHGPIAKRMGRFDVILTLIAVGPRFAALRDQMLAPRSMPTPLDTVVVAGSPVGADAAIVRIAAERFEAASRALRPSFAELARVIGDDPFARKW